MNKVRGNRMRSVKAASTAVFAALFMALAIAPSGANAAKIDNPSPPNFRAELTGGYLQMVGSNGTVLPLPLDFNAMDPPLPNPSFTGSITLDGNGNGVINIPQANIIFPPIQVDLSGSPVTIRLVPVGNATGLINPLTGRVDFSLAIRIKAEGSVSSVPLGNTCYVGGSTPASAVQIATQTHYGTFPDASGVYVADFVDGTSPGSGGWIAAEPYSDESGSWATKPRPAPGFPVGGTRPLPSQISLAPADIFPRVAGAWRGVNETFAAPTGGGCGSSTVDSTLNDQLGLPSVAGASTVVFDFKFAATPDRPGAQAMVQKAVKANFVAPGISPSPWRNTDTPIAVSAQTVNIDASSSYFKVGGHGSERYQFDLGTGSFGAWTTEPVASFVAPIISEGGQPLTLPIRLRAKDSQGDIDTTTRQLRILPASDISIDTSASSLAGASFRAGSPGEVDIDVKNNSATDASSLPLHLTASLPSGVSMSNFNGPPSWTCNNSATAIDCTLPQGQLAAGATSHFDLAVSVDTGTADPAAINSTVAMSGDPSPANNTDNISVDVVKTDLAVAITRTEDLIANGWTPYEIDVENVGDGSTVGGSTLSVSLPPGFSYRTAGSGGTGWNCTTPVNPQNIVCAHTGELAGGASASPLTIVAKIDRTADAVPSTVSASIATQGDANAFGGADTDEDTETVQVLPDLSVDSAVAGSYVVGDPGTIDYTTTNESVLPITGPTTITSSLPAGITVDSVAGDGWDCSATVPDSAEISCERAGGLAAGETSPAVTATVSVVQAAHPGVVIDVTVANAADGFGGNDSDSTEVQVRRLDVAIQKLAVKPFNVGIEGRYRLNVTNIGEAATVGDVVVTDELPVGLALRGASGAGWDCSESQVGQRVIHCVLTSTLGPGVQAAPIEARVDVLDAAAEAGTVVNTAYVDTPRDTRGVAADEAITGNNVSTVSTTAVAVDLGIVSTHQGAFMVESEDVYSLTVRNVGFFGTDPGEAITVTDDLPEGIVPIVDEIEVTRPGWTCEEEDGDVECVLEAPSPTDSAMAPESAVTIDIPVEVTDAAADDSTNLAEVSTARDTNPELSPNNRSEDPTTVTRIDLAVDAEQSVPSRAGGIGELAVDLDNIGSHATTAPSTVVVSLAEGTTYRPTGSTTAGWTCASPGAGTQVSCVRTQSIGAGGSAPALKIRTNVSASAPADWTTTVTAATDQEADTRLENNSDEVESSLETVDLTVDKSHDPGNVKAGSRASFKITVENVGNVASTGTIRVEDTVNGSFTNVTASGPGWTCTVTGNAVACTRTASLPAGDQTPQITVAFDIPAAVSGTRNSTATVSNSGDPFTANNSATDPIQVVSTADVQVSIDQPSTTRVGEVIHATYNVRNVGSAETSGSPGVTLKITASEGLVPLDTVDSGAWDCSAVPASGSVLAYFDCALTEPLAAGGNAPLTGEFEVLQPTNSQASTLAIVRTPGDLNRGNDGALAFSDIIGFDLETTVAVPSGSTEYFDAGVTTRRAIQIANVGTTATTGPITAKVTLPPGVVWDETDPVGAPWSCHPQSQVVNCDYSGGQVAAAASLPNLTLALRAGRANAPEITISYTAEIANDASFANNTVSREDRVRFEPDTAITSGPSGTTTSRAASVAFTSDDETATFECRLDAGAFEPCASPKSLSGLGIGQHVLSVRAVNEHSTPDSTPARSEWTVESEGEPVGPFKNVEATLTEGTLSLADLGSVPLPADQIKLAGRRYDNGALVIPKEGVQFLPVTQVIEDALGGQDANVEISISATGDGIGSLPKTDGSASLTLPVRADIKATLGPLNPIPEGTECALKPVLFDLSGNYVAATKTLTLGAPGIGFPTLTGCGPLATTIDDAIGLPRNDIQLATTFAVEELPDEACPAGKTGTPPNCSDLPAGKAILAKPTVKTKKTVKSGKTATITAGVKNTGTGAAANVKVCLTLKQAKQLAKGKAKICKTIKSIVAGATGKATFKVNTKKIKAKKKKLNYTVDASASGLKKPKNYVGHVTLLKQ